jgi:hypothetical protein
MAHTARSPTRRAAGRSAATDLREVFRRRTGALIERLTAQASEETLAAALEAASDFGGLVRMLSDMAPIALSADTIDPMAEAIARGAVAKQELLTDAGGAWSSSQVAQHLGISRQAVDKRRKKQQLLALRAGNGDYLYPGCQFTDDGVVPRLDRFLRAFPASGEWTRLNVLLAPAEEIGGISPLDALRNGDSESAATVAAMFGEQGGPVEIPD